MIDMPVRRMASLLTAALLISPATFAYEVPLDSRSVREAYFLGQRHDERTSTFLGTYVKHLPFPQKGPYISTITLLTPYAQVVDLSRQRTLGYSAQQAEQDYHGRGDSIRVCVRIEFTATYGAVEARKSADNAGAEQNFTLRPEDFWKDFRFGLSQEDAWIESREIRGEPTYEPGRPNGSSYMNGAQVWLEFDANKIASTDTTVEVFTPDGQHVIAKFDLAKLR
jgi:hypothetical protein